VSIIVVLDAFGEESLGAPAASFQGFRRSPVFPLQGLRDAETDTQKTGFQETIYGEKFLRLPC
jgi:hypothetical protein